MKWVLSSSITVLPQHRTDEPLLYHIPYFIHQQPIPLAPSFPSVKEMRSIVFEYNCTDLIENTFYSQIVTSNWTSHPNCFFQFLMNWILMILCSSIVINIGNQHPTVVSDLLIFFIVINLCKKHKKEASFPREFNGIRMGLSAFILLPFTVPEFTKNYVCLCPSSKIHLLSLALK